MCSPVSDQRTKPSTRSQPPATSEGGGIATRTRSRAHRQAAPEARPSRAHAASLVEVACCPSAAASWPRAAHPPPSASPRARPRAATPAPRSSQLAPARRLRLDTGSGVVRRPPPAAGTIKKGLIVYFIPKDTQNPYEVSPTRVAQRRSTELGGKVVVSSGHRRTRPRRRSRRSRRRSRPHADAIVIAGNDPTALCPSLGQAQAAGIKVVSFDSDVDAAPNHLFINQADTKQIGTSEVDLLAKEIDSTGEIAILSAAATRDEPERLDRLHEDSSSTSTRT